jgi:phosphoribosylamine--glycine ligase
MLTADGPKILEYNARFGDPETQVVVPLYGDGLFDLLLSVGEGRLKTSSHAVSGAAVTVILASHGYPQSPRKGDVITGLGRDGQLAEAVEGVTVFHAGTAIDDSGQFITAGGRVLAVTGVAETIAEARRRAYHGASLITFEGRVMRSDIALAVA